MVRAAAAVRVVAKELHPGSNMNPYAATSARKRSTKVVQVSQADL